MSAVRPTAGAPAVTVVIPTLNRKALLLRTLHSVLRQQDVRLLVVVVVDGGTDGSIEAVRSLGDARVRVVQHASPRGVSAARNAGLAVVGTEWVAFVDDDDLFAPSKLAAQLAAVQREGRAQWSCGGAIDVEGDAVPRLWHAPPVADRIAEQLLVKNVIPGGGSGVLVRTDLARSVGAFDETISNLADWDFYIRLALHAEVAPVDDYLVAYTVHAVGMSVNARRSVVEYEYLAEKYAEERARHQVQLDRGDWSLYIGSVAWRGRDRLFAIRHLGAAVRSDPSLRRIILILRTLVPTRLRALKRRLAPDVRRVAWLAAYEQWQLNGTAGER